MSDRFLLRLADAQACMGRNGDGPCLQLTQVSEAEHESDNAQQLRVYPYCPLHLYIDFPDPTPEELETQRFCIANFTIHRFGDQGSAEIHGPCPAGSIPAPYEDEEAQAWDVTYRDGQGSERRGVAVYLMWEARWEWHELAAAPV